MTTVQEGKPALNAVVREVRSLAMMLRAIAFTSLCQITISSHGIQVITEVNCVLQATAYLSSGLFEAYEYAAPEQDMSTTRRQIDDEDEEYEAEIPTTVLEVSLSDLLVCLNIYGSSSTNGGKSRDGEEEPFGGGKGDGGGAAVTAAAARRRMEDGGSSTEMKIRYDGVGHPLILELQEGSTTTRCELSTFDANTASITDMTFSSDTVIGQAIMASKDLTEAIQSIDSSTREVTISFLNSGPSKSKKEASKYDRDGRGEDGAVSSAFDARLPRASSSIVLSTARDDAEDEDNEETFLRRNGADHGQERHGSRKTQQMLRIRAEGDTGSIELDFPNHFHVFEMFLSIRESSTTFQFENLQRCLKALQTSLKTSLRIDETGMMSLQCLFPRKAEQAAAAQADPHNRSMKIDPERQGFVELRMLPLATDQDED